jgi:hypothetical protein
VTRGAPVMMLPRHELVSVGWFGEVFMSVSLIIRHAGPMVSECQRDVIPALPASGLFGVHFIVRSASEAMLPPATRPLSGVDACSQDQQPETKNPHIENLREW